MNDEDLKNLWQGQPLREPPSAKQLVSAMQNKTSRLRGIVNARDFREVLACVVLMIVFGCFAYNERAPVARLGNLMVIGSLIFIAWKLVYTRRSTPPAPPGATIVESLRAELNAVSAQSRLLGSVFWWYLLPGLLGLLVATWGERNDLYAKIFCTLFYIAVDAFLYWLNQRARAKELLPVEAQLQSLLHAAETGEPVDQTHVESLRPMVLSMAAADQVKPVEFKVAFWQLALYGEIGFIGIWFFLMAGIGVRSEKAQAKAPAIVQPGTAAETNRYFVVTRTVVDLFNAGNYAAVQKLYDTEMGRAFPPRESTEFYTGLAEDFGRIISIDGPATNGYQGWTAFRLHCQHGELIMSLALDEDGEISGIYFKPPPPPPLNMKSFVLRFLSWPRLVWLVLFFLAGLLYSRILQKTTERAVGVSSLGIHLRKGQILFLWDEIKEIRTFRLLNIRSLRLIRESGEKTIMPWSSLEHHAELKAAVEKFAPANHPLRQYLSLLTRG